MLFVDTDNGLGSARADIDDGLALVYLHRKGLSFEVNSVYGNCSEKESFQNTEALAQWLKAHWSLHRGADFAHMRVTEASTLIASKATQILALGPLTNISTAIQTRPDIIHQLKHVICVGGNPASRGRFPPYWPHEFNLVKDGLATRQVLGCGAKVTVVPLNIARQITLHPVALNEKFPRWIQQAIRARSRRNLLVHRTRKLFLFDVTAAVFLSCPQLFTVRPMKVGTHRNGALTFTKSTYSIEMIVDFNRQAVQQEFESVVFS